jgi:hypothetical protein
MRASDFKPGDIVMAKDVWANMWRDEAIGFRPTVPGQSMLVLDARPVYDIGGEDEIYHLKVLVDSEVWLIGSTNVKLVTRVEE